ncbi:MAG TPA: hypothetical protein VM571_10630 [Noviherbaspirillum sp.]|nr:hypothetical protein [Noviherbaspirillum sp.]
MSDACDGSQRCCCHDCTSTLSAGTDPLEGYAVHFDPLFHALAQRHHFHTDYR